MRRHALFFALVCSGTPALVVACAKQPSEGAPARVAEAAAARPSSEPGSTGAADASAATAPAPGTASAAASAASADAGVRDASAATAPDEPPPKVKLVTIGMHVGGGPYDEPTKEPMKRSVEPHFKELARCWRLVSRPQQTDVGVDLVIEAAGGRARVSNPRTTATGEGFLPCVVAFFESVEFLPPKNGRTVVSYSVRFLP
ncbi:MAG: hypothetical protein JWP87_5311 [Labilithrix sp.]|nr:hypothetical protein [Labilithrix sp.]